MTALVSLLFIAMILLIVKLQIFLTLVYLLFLVTIDNTIELTSTTSKERMTTNIVFAGATSVN